MGLDIAKLADDLGDGTFSVRTTGLSAHRHAEIEIAPIPFEGVEAAAKIIDYVVDAVVAKGKQLKPGENVGLPLSIAGHDEVRPIFLGVHATEHTIPVGGFFAKLRGTATLGVLRLSDLAGPRSGPPLQAVAAMMLYRANCRVVMGDREGALQELRQSIQIAPGEPQAGPPPDFEPPDDAAWNWQNHLGYLRLAELGDAEESAASYACVYGRFDWLAHRDLGGSPSELTNTPETALYEDAKRILALNLADSESAPGPHEGMRFVPSPLWLPGENGVAVRETSILPAGFVSYCFGDRLASPDVGDSLAREAAAYVARHLAAPWTVLAKTEHARDLYGRSPFRREVPGVAYRPWHFLLSAVLAEGARTLHAGATPEELRQSFGLGPNDPAVSASLAKKMATLEAWEAEQYASALSAP